MGTSSAGMRWPRKVLNGSQQDLDRRARAICFWYRSGIAPRLQRIAAAHRSESARWELPFVAQIFGTGPHSPSALWHIGVSLGESDGSAATSSCRNGRLPDESASTADSL